MAVLWRKSLEVGHAEIDAQHQELFARVNKLLESCTQGKALAEIGVTMQFLEDYVITHFHHEEVFMLKNHYLDYQAHKAQHTLFIKDFNKLKTLFEKSGASVMFVVEANHLLVEWLISHVTREDRKLVSHLKKAA